MQGGYTCSRCLRALERASKLQQIVQHFSSRPSSTLNRAPLRRANRPVISGLGVRYQTSSASIEPDPNDVPPVAEEQNAKDLSRIKSLSGNVLLEPNNLFHPLSISPSPDMRRRGAFLKNHAYCPHPSHRQTRLPASPADPESRKTPDVAREPPAFVKFECPDCGIPVSCSQEHWADDYENHVELCETLRQINEDDHDLRSGRFFPEFEYPVPPMEEQLPNMTTWDTFLYTREFNAINDERPLRQVTKLLSYPMTVASILHELSPYNIRKDGRLTPEGLKSLTALRYNLHPPRRGANDSIKGIRLMPPSVRIFVVGARAESSLPRSVWLQMAYLFPRATFHIHMIGPEAMMNRDAEFPLPERTPGNPFGAVIEDRIATEMRVSTYVEYFHTLHEAKQFHPYDPYFDCFMLFHPGLGHPASSHEWAATLPQLLETKIPVICTGYTKWDMERDRKWVEDTVGGETDILMEPGENIFRSLRWDLNDYDPTDISCANWGVWAFRGKRYEAQMKD